MEKRFIVFRQTTTAKSGGHSVHLSRMGSTARRSRSTGMSMIELLIVIAGIMIVAGIAIPNFQNTMQTNRVQGDVNVLYAQLSMAKLRGASSFSHSELLCSNTQISSKPGCQIYLKPYSPSASTSYALDTTSANHTTDTLILSSGDTFPTSFSGISAGAGPQSGGSPSQTLAICFTTRGTPVSCTDNTTPTTPVLYLQSSNNVNYAISVGISGALTIYRWTGSTWFQIS